MFKRLICLMLVVAFALTSVGMAFAIDADGNKRKGKYLYRKNCRTCHAEGKEASDMSPASKVQADWKAIFEKMSMECKGKWGEKVNEKAIADIYTYLYKHAKDSPSPAKCK